MEHEKFADVLAEMSFVALLAIALQTFLQMKYYLLIAVGIH